MLQRCILSLLVIIWGVVAAVACSSQPAPSSAAQSKIDQPETAKPAETSTPAAQAKADPSQAAKPTEVAAPSQPGQKVDGVILYYEDGTQFELISPQGSRILIDVRDPARISSPISVSDVLLTTHAQSNYFSAITVRSFPGRQLNQTEGELTLADVAIKGIKSARFSNAPVGGNYIFVIEMGGLRIAHFGDCGQGQLTPEQLDQLGRVDVALAPLEGYSADTGVSLGSRKAFAVMDQVKPKLIIPTRGSRDAGVIKEAAKKWVEAYVGVGKITISPAMLSDTSKLLVVGDSFLAAGYKKLYNLADWKN